MTVHLIWRDSSSMPDRQDAFWVACSAAEVDTIVLLEMASTFDQPAAISIDHPGHSVSCQSAT